MKEDCKSLEEELKQLSEELNIPIDDLKDDEINRRIQQEEANHNEEMKQRYD